MSNKNYYVSWRSRETCQAMELTEDTVLPVEIVTGEGTVGTKKFGAGDYEVRQGGRVFGRTKSDHESRFERTRSRREGGEEGK